MAINPFRFAFNPAPQRPAQPAQGSAPSPDDWPDPARQNSASSMRQEANALSARAANFAPVKSPWEGLARLGEGLEAGIAQGQADRAEREQRNADWLASSEPGAQTVDPLNINPQRQFPGILGIGRSLSSLFGRGGNDSGGSTGGLW